MDSKIQGWAMLMSVEDKAIEKKSSNSKANPDILIAK